MSFVKLSIFGTSFEVSKSSTIARSDVDRSNFQVTTRYVDLQPVGMGEHRSSRSPLIVQAYSIDPQAPSALCGTFVPRLQMIAEGSRLLNGVIVQFSKGSAYGVICCDQEDYETVQHPSSEQTDVSRIEAFEAHSARERQYQDDY